MIDARYRSAQRYAPGSLEELAWGLRTGELRPAGPRRAWSPTPMQRLFAQDALQSNRLWFNCHAAGAQNLLLRLCARARAKWDCCPHTGVVRHQYRPTVRRARRVYARLLAWAEAILETHEVTLLASMWGDRERLATALARGDSGTRN